MELRQLRYFLKAKELLNFTEASKALFISQSTLSQQIKQLEDEIGAPLFDRIGKRIYLTEPGQLFGEHAAQSLRHANDAKALIKDLANIQGGTLNIGATFALRNVLKHALLSFSQSFPKVIVNIHFDTSDELLVKLEKLELDFILTFNETTTDPQFEYTKLFSSPMVLVTARGSELEQRKSIEINDLATIPLAMPAKGYSTMQYLETLISQTNLQPNIRMSINDIPTLIELVKTGNWHTILTKVSIIGEGLSTVPIRDRDMSRTAMIISVKQAYHSKAAAKFYSYISEEIERNVNF